MKILRIVNVNIASNTNIVVTFTESLTTLLVPANVSILSETSNVPDSEVLEVSVLNGNLDITCQPLTQFSDYFLQFQSTDNNPFISINGDAIISEDGTSNRFLITAPIDLDNPVKSYLGSFFKDNIYDLSDTTVIGTYINSLATNLSRALYDIRQSKNENYLSFNIIDEQHFRGTGAFDRLNEESAYDVFRVGLTPTASNVNTSFVFDDVPDFPITLQGKTAIDIILASSNDQENTFNINSLTFNLKNSPVTQVQNIIFTFTTADPTYVYNIEQLGYQIQNSRYDQNFASSYLLLEDNQVKLNEAVLQDPKFALDQIFNIQITYQYKDVGIDVDPTSVSVFTTLQSVREVLPPIINVFSLQHTPITNSSNNIPTLNGVVFIDPNSNTGAPHPAFITELPFRLNALPSTPGEYSIDYPTATVYVFGNDNTNNGTGASPPLATYFYKLTYVNQIDYVYDVNLLDLVALPLGNLVNQPGTINFNFEKVLIPGTDYVAEVHQEALSERIDNRLNALNILTTANSPITNVFQVINETSGEIYTVDRWNDNQVFIRYNNPPRIVSETGENVSFNLITNELLFVNNTNINSDGYRIYTIFLANDIIIDSTQDGIGSSFNTSLVLTNGNVFVNEKWYNQEFDNLININRLNNIGEYMVDYKNGIIYVAVSSHQDFNIGTATYKNDNIVPKFPHLLSVDDIYYRISVLNPVNKKFNYVSFGENFIIPEGLDVSDEAFLNDTIGAPYQLFQGLVGAFITNTFVPGVTNQVKFVRSVFEFEDLSNNINPINFSNVSSSNGFNITVGSIVKQSFENVQFDGTNFFITLNENIQYLSPNINYQFNIKRVSDQADLWGTGGTIVSGNPLKLILPGINSPAIGQMVEVNYSFTIIPISRVIVDYNKGDFFVDYTYLADEILVSYEYGDNLLDFRQGNALSTGDQYYVSYTIGALRTALLKNFGTLVNVPDLSTVDLQLNRERYRDALQAALSSFLQGPTVKAIKNIGQIISHIEPQVIESAFQTWSLGDSLLFPRTVETSGNFQLLPAKYGNGALINNPLQTITLPVNSNLRLEEGTFEEWIFPQWNGLDNDATLIWTITQDGYAIDTTKVFIGGGEYHPTLDLQNNFTLNKFSQVNGIPNFNKDGIFIYYTNDPTNSYQRWYVQLIDGYVSPDTSTYKFVINSSGKFYDLQSLTFPQPSNLTKTTSLSKATVNIVADGYIDEGFTFVSDVDHYILDLGNSNNKSRLSIFKDPSGYLNFRVFDKSGSLYNLSSDVSSWKANQQHFVSASWKLNTQQEQDEMHLFVDGLEVPNIIKYGQRLAPYLHENFRTVDPEEIVGISNRDIIGSDDLTTTINSNIVSSSINFSQFQIFIGDTIFINELGFDPNGYLITNIDGQTLTLNQFMPSTLIDDGKFSVNQTAYNLLSDISVASNITVSTLNVFTTGSDLQTNVGSSIVSSASLNFTDLNIQPGYLLRIDNPSFAITYTILNISGHNLTVNDTLSVNGTFTFQIYSNTQENELPGKRALDPNYQIDSNNKLTIFNGVLANDLILIRTLGLNFREYKKSYYLWSNLTENLIMTRLPSPINLDSVDITKTILPITTIGASNSTIVSGEFISNNLLTDQPSSTQFGGRTLSATISGTNVDFSTPVSVNILGTSNGTNPTAETLSFTDYGTLDFVHPYSNITHISVNVKPLNINKNALAIQVNEKYPITHGEFDGYFPIIQYSYPITLGYNLSSDGYGMVEDGYNIFSDLDNSNYLVIFSPSSVAGSYLITGISEDRHQLNIVPLNGSLPLSNFENGIYQVLNVNQYRSGLQNGFFTFERNDQIGQPYLLTNGNYLFDYQTYLHIPFDALNGNIFFGSDLNGSNQADAILDQVKISSVTLTDTRIGEVVQARETSITKDFNSLIALTPSPTTLVLLNFAELPFNNQASIYTTQLPIDENHFQSNFTINDNFDPSTVFLNKPLLIPNEGILNTKNQGTIEFWLSPLFDTANDPNIRFYFDAYGAVVEELTSNTNSSVILSNPASQILSVKLAANPNGQDYFASGTLDINTQRAIQEEGVSVGNAVVITSEPVLQVISVVIIGDLTNTDYFDNGSIGSDGQTLYLGKALPENNLPLLITYQSTNNKNTTLNTQIIRLNKRLPYQNTGVIVNYLPQGLQGDRISIYKDTFGYINFGITASNTDYVVRAPTRWSKDTWHRIKASYKINGGISNDEMRLFLDGYQYTDFLFGEDLIFGNSPVVMGAITVGDGYSLNNVNIQFSDPINDIFIGAQYNQQYPTFSLLNNLRISNISRPLFSPFGEPIDVNYSNNLSTVFPATKDLFTTFLLDINPTLIKNNNFAILTDRNVGSFDFTVNIFDSLDIVKDGGAQVVQILENLINILKPANCVAFIDYINDAGVATSSPLN